MTKHTEAALAATPAVSWTPDPKAPWRCLICGSERSACTCIPREGTAPAVGGGTHSLSQTLQTAEKLANAVSAAPPASPLRGREPIKEATQAQHFDLPKGEPARFVRNGILETCQCTDCAALASPPEQPAKETSK